MKPAIQNGLDNHYSYAVFNVHYGNFERGSYAASEYGQGLGPSLDVTPEPATLALLALGGLGMLARRKRK